MMSIALGWRDEAGFRHKALRLLGWGATLGLLVFLVSPPADSRLSALVTGFPVLLAFGCLFAEWRRGEGGGFAATMAFAVAGAIAQVGWARFYADTLAGAPVMAAGAGAAAGLVVALGHLPHSLTLVSRKVERRAEVVAAALRAHGQADMAALLGTASTRWSAVRASLADDVRATSAIEDAMLRLLAEAGHFARSAPSAAMPSRADVDARLSLLDQLRAEARDENARQQLGEARAAVLAQGRHLEDIERSRERALALIHRYVAAMERLHLAVLGQRSLDASCRTTVLGPIIDDLVMLAEDLDARQAATQASAAPDA